MHVKIVAADPLTIPTPALVVGCFEDGPEGQLLSRLDTALAGVISTLYRQKEFTGKRLKVKLLHTLGRLPAQRIVLVGLGKRRELDGERIRQAAGAVAQALRGAGVASSVTVLHCAAESAGMAIQEVVEGSLLGGYAFLQYRTEPKEQVDPEELTLVLAKKSEVKQAERVCREVEAVCAAACHARDMVGHPGNVATPTFLAEQASTMAARYGIRCTVLDREGIEREGMGGLLAVGAGSVQSPRFIVLEYRGGPESMRPVALVGKGVTFDSGGISLKPREGMERMKDDMAGAAAVIATLQAVAALALPVNVVGLVPAAENMPDGRAYKPGDIVKTMAGKTIEINNTDAEGRMILCDALHYASTFKPAAIIDLATLTGACLVALGTQATGLMGTDDGLKRALKKAGERTGERLWELPLWEEYGEAMKSDVADMKNAGGPHAGTITAAWFLKQFVGKAKWAHLDIAGTAWEEKGKHYLPKGATGVGVRLLVDYLRGLG
ncbi:MAG: leucyl aminopeptidase [Geobacter sp.]|nr:leucyl aminopeptidase [Geobacter sp.]